MMKLITSIAPRPQVLKKTLQVVIWLLVTIWISIQAQYESYKVAAEAHLYDES
jgi:hypothetical protein